MPFPVTYLIDQLSPSETFIRRELDQLRRRNWPIFTRLLKGGTSPLKFTLTGCPDGLRWRFFRAAGARVLGELFRSPRTAARIAKRLPQVGHLIAKTGECDSRLLHAHFAGITADLAGIAARTLGLPWTCSVHAYDVFTCPPKLLYRRLRSAAGVTACSRLAAEAVIASGIPAERVSVIRHGVSLNEYPFDSIQPDGVLFFAGRLEPKKGLDTLLHACALAQSRGQRFTCVIAGKGSCEAELRALSERLGLDPCVVFVGWQSQEETRSRVMDATVVVLPSRRTHDGDRDGVPNILVEALALGTTVLTTTASAAGEVIADGVNGLIVPPDDPERLADAIVLALSTKELLLRLAKAGRQTAEAEFDSSKNIVQLEAFFTRATSPTPGARA